jgi:hypothetical protein
MRKGFVRAFAQASRLVEPNEQQTSATQRVVGQAEIANDFACRLTLEKLLDLLESGQSLARLAKLRQHPG